MSVSDPSTVPARVRAIALRQPGHLAVAMDRERLTYRQLDRRANWLARRLRTMGVGPESVVALLTGRSPDHTVAALAVMKAGGAYLPLDAAFPAARIRTILEDSGACVLIAHRSLAANAACPVLLIDAEPMGEADEPPPGAIEPASLAYVIYTSGSTGAPKGVEITHANLAGLADWHANAFQVGEDDRASHVAGLGFDASVWETWGALCAGASLHVANDAQRTNAASMREWFAAEGITIAFAPTVMAHQLIAMEWPRNTELRTLLTGADRLQHRPAPGLPFRLINNYGPTEATVLATSGEVESAGAPVPSIGKPANGATIHIVDGEIVIAGPLVGRGYRNRPAETAERFIANPFGEGRAYRTGDRGRLLDNGEIEFLGRIDDQVKIRGYRIEPGEVEAALARCPGVSAAAVAARADESGDPSLVGYVVLAKGASFSPAGLARSLSASLPDYMIPSVFVRLDALPVNASGKCDRAALPAPGQRDAAPAAGDVQARISSIAANLLGRPAVDPNANFFLLGGHSLLAAQLLTQVNRSFGVKVGLRQIFQAPTAALLADEVLKLAGL